MEREGEREVMIHTATRYHLSAPSVLEGNLCSSVSNSSVASCAVGSFEELILAVRRSARIGREDVGIGFIESTGLYDSLKGFCKCFSICRWHVAGRGSFGATMYRRDQVLNALRAESFGVFLAVKGLVGAGI